MAEAGRLPADIDAQPLVQAALALRPALRRRHAEIEQAGRLPADLVETLRAADFYRLVAPRPLGGLELDPLTFLRIVESLSEGCGSVGWNVCNNNIIQLVTLGLPDDGIAEIYGNGKPVVIAGTAIQGGGQAVPVDGGYRVSGRWSFGSGCHESSWMLGSFQILDGDAPRRGADGAPRFWRGVFRRTEVEILPGTWDVDGMRGTGSLDWTVSDVFLPAHRVMDHPPGQLDNQWARWPGTSYALPVQAWLGPHHCSVITGIARAGIEALVELAGAKTPRGPQRGNLVRDNSQVQEAVGRADAMLNAGRVYRSATIAELWDTVAAGRPTTAEQRARCRLAATHAADCARDAMDLMFRHGGSTGYRHDSRLAQCWRDLQVVGQAATLLPEWYPLAGRILLGMEPSPRLT
jgi:alkylation response protein AidB-like acyl-CoA dehydrogenase